MSIRKISAAALLFSIAFLFLATSSLRAQQQKRLLSAKTEHYFVASDVSEEYSQKIADYMEKMYEVYGELLNRQPPKEQKPFRLIIYKDTNAFADRMLKKHRQTKYEKPNAIPSFTYLHYGQGNIRNEFCGFVIDDAPMFDRLRHEGFHQYLRSIIDRPPQWLNEGLAEMLEGYNWTDEEGLSPFPSRGYLRTMREGILDVDPGALTKKYNPIPIEEIMEASKSDWMKTSQTSYALSWAACYYLTHGPQKNRGLIGKIVNSLEPNAQRPENTLAALKTLKSNVDLEEFEKEMLEFFRELKPPGHAAFNNGQVLMKKKKYAEAIEMFSDAIEADDLNARAFYFRGISYYSTSKFDEAESDLKRSIALFPEYSSAIFSLGKVYIYKKDYEQATKYLDMAKKFGTPDRSTARWYGEIKKAKSKR